MIQLFPFQKLVEKTIDPGKDHIHIKERDKDKIEKYKKDIEKGDVFPMPELIEIDKNQYSIINGNKRISAYKILNRSFKAKVYINDYPNLFPDQRPKDLTPEEKAKEILKGKGGNNV